MMAKLGTMGTAAAILPPPLIIALFALGVPLITLMRWIANGGARVWNTDGLNAACPQPPGFGLIAG